MRPQVLILLLAVAASDARGETRFAPLPDDEEALLQEAVEARWPETLLPFALEALSDVDRALALGRRHAQAQEHTAAVAWFERVVALERHCTPTHTPDVLYAIGVLSWKRLNHHPEISGAERLRIAAQGLTALSRRAALDPAHSPTLSYLGLVHLERALPMDIALAGGFRAAAFAAAAHKR